MQAIIGLPNDRKGLLGRSVCQITCTHGMRPRQSYAIEHYPFQGVDGTLRLHSLN
jgi:hypothetical protein